MIGKKSLLVSLGILSCVFFGCGALNNRIVPGKTISRISYTGSDDGETILKKFHNNTSIRFNQVLDEKRLGMDSSYSARNKSQKQKDKEVSDIKPVDLMKDYVRVAYAEKAALFDSGFAFKADINKLWEDLPGLFSRFIDSEENELTLKLFPIVIDLIILGKDPSRTVKVYEAACSFYNKVFKERTGIKIDYKQMCESSDGIEIQIENFGNIKVLPGLLVIPIESYFLSEMRTTKSQPVDLLKIYDGAGDAKLVKERPAYQHVLNALNARLEALVEIVLEKASPYWTPDKSKLIKTLQANGKAKVSDVKWLLENQEQLVIFGENFNEQRGAAKLHISESAPMFRQDGEKIARIPLNHQQSEADKIYKLLFEKSQDNMLTQIEKTYNNAVSRVIKNGLTNVGRNQIELKPVS